jgi:hypothetical protein
VAQPDRRKPGGDGAPQEGEGDIRAITITVVRKLFGARDNQMVSAERERGPIIPHADFGDPECCGCLLGMFRGDQAEIRCNECDAIIRTVPAPDLERTLTEMELNGDIASAICPHCGAVHLAPGFSRLIAFLCDKCGRGVRLSEEPFD